MSRSQKSSSGDSTATHPYITAENLKYGHSKPEWEKSVIKRNPGKANIWTELSRFDSRGEKYLQWDSRTCPIINKTI